MEDDNAYRSLNLLRHIIEKHLIPKEEFVFGFADLIKPTVSPGSGNHGKYLKHNCGICVSVCPIGEK